MRRQGLLALALVCLPAVAQANTITVGNHILPTDSTSTVDMLINGTDLYNYMELFMLINGGVGPAPRVTAVFSDTAGAIPTANLAVSVWAGGDAVIYPSPDGTYPTDTGLRTAVAFGTAGGALQNTEGVFVTLAIDTMGVPPGVYSVSLTDNPFLGISGLFTVLSPPVPVPLVIINGTITVIPEPASVVMGLFAVAGLAVVAVRRHRARHVMAVPGRVINPL